MADDQAQSKQERKDFFLSYTNADRQWAEWIAWQLEAAGYSVYLRVWDLRPGSNFVLEIHQALSQEQRVLCLLSPDYLASPAQQAEWAAVWYHDQTAQQHLVVPVRVRFYEIAGLLGALTPLDLVELDEAQARETLLAGLRDERAKPTQTPRYPGPTPHFPGALPARWMVPFRHNSLFTGRETMLQQIHETLTRGKRVALTLVISGLGGIGKTQVALEYTYRYFSEYQAVFWMRADSQQSIFSSFLEMANLLQLPEQKEQETALIVSAVQRWYRSHPDWLLIVDNADGLDLVQPFLPEGQGHIILTSRNRITRGMADETLLLDVMDADEGALLLLRCTKWVRSNQSLEAISEQELAEAKKLVDILGGLPLALDQAGAYIEETACSLSDYQQRYQTRRARLLQRRGGLVPDHPNSVTATWSLAFEKVEQFNPAAADLLRLCAFLAPDVIPEEIITKGAADLGPVLEPVASDPVDLDEAIATLRAYSLVHRNAAEKTLSMHQLVQAVLKDQMDKQNRKLWSERVVRAVNAAFPKVEHQNWSQCERLLPNALVAAQLIKQLSRSAAQLIEHEQLSRSEAALLLNKTGYYLKEHARYTEAVPLYDLCLTIRKRSLGDDHPDVAQSLSNLANLYSELGQYEKAVPLYQNSLQIWERIRGDDHLSVAYPLNNLAIIYKVQAEYEKAEQLYERSLPIWEQNRGADHPDRARPLNNLGVLCGELGKYEEAETLFRRSQSILERSLGDSHPDLAQCLSNLANLSTEQDKYAEAESLYQKSLCILKQNLRSEYSDAAYPLNGRGILLMKQRNYTDAEKLFKHSLNIWKPILGPDHPQVAYALHNLAVLTMKQGRDEDNREWDKKAEDLFEHSLAIWEEKLGSKDPKHIHIHTKTCAKNYAILFHILQRDAKAQELAKKYNFTDEPLAEDGLVAISTFRSFRLYENFEKR